MQKIPATTPNKRRMASVLDVVIETTKALSPAPKRIVEAMEVQAEAEAMKAGPSVPIEMEPAAPEEKTARQIAPEKIKAPAPEAPNENIDYIIRHASGKKLSQEGILEARHFAQRLKYLKGALVFVGAKAKTPPFARCLRRPRCTNGDKTTGRLTLRPIRHRTKACDEVVSSCDLVQYGGPRVIRPIVTGPAWPLRITGLICKGIPVITVYNPALWEYSGDNLGV
jgi:hypothetical protein